VIRFPILAELPTTPFSGDDVVRSVECSASDGDGPGRVSVEVDGKPEVLAFYGAAPEGAPADPVIFLRGDAVEKRDSEVVANEWYVAATAYDVQALTEQLSSSFHRPYVHLARPGILVPRVAISTDGGRARSRWSMRRSPGSRRILAGVASISSANPAAAISWPRCSRAATISVAQ